MYMYIYIYIWKKHVYIKYIIYKMYIYKSQNKTLNLDHLKDRGWNMH